MARTAGEGASAESLRVLQAAFPPTATAAAEVPRDSTRSVLEELAARARDGDRPVVLRGPAGIGRTTLLRQLAASLEADARAVYLAYAALPPDELAAWAVGLLELEPGGDPQAALLAEAERLYGEGRHLLLLIDDANSISDATAAAVVRWAAESEGGLRPVLAFVEDRAVEERVARLGGAAQVMLGAPLTFAEAQRWVRAQMEATAASPEVAREFDEEAVASLHDETGGVPRLFQAAAARRVWRALRGAGELPVASDVVAWDALAAPLPDRTRHEKQALLAEEEAARRAQEAAARDAEADAARRAEEQARQRAEAEAAEIAQQEARVAAEAEAARLAAQAEAERVEEVARRAAEQEARRAAEAEAQRAAAEEARRAAEAEAQRVAEEEAARAAEAEAHRKAEQEAARQAAAEAEAQREAAERQAEEEARRLHEAEAAREAAAEAEREAEAQAAREAAEEAQRRIDAEAAQRAEAEAQRQVEEESRRLAAEVAALEAEAEARRRVEDAASAAGEPAAGEADADPADQAAEAVVDPAALAATRAEEEARASALALRRAADAERLRAEAEAVRRAEEEALQEADLAAEPLEGAAAEQAALREDASRAEAESLDDLAQHVLDADEGAEREEDAFGLPELQPRRPMRTLAPAPPVRTILGAIALVVFAAAALPLTRMWLEATAIGDASSVASDAGTQALSTGAAASGTLTPPTETAVEDPDSPPPVTPIPVQINAAPWARIRVDGRELGETPLADVPLMPGSHEFEAIFPDGRTVERSVVVAPNHRHLVFE